MLSFKTHLEENIRSYGSYAEYDLKRKIIEIGQKHHLDKLVDDPDPGVRAMVADRGYKEHLDKLVDDPHPTVREVVILPDKNSMTTRPHKEHLDKLVKDSSADVRRRVARYGNDEHRDILVNDREPEVREEVAWYGNQGHLDKLHNDKSYYVRQVVTTRSKNIEALKHMSIHDVNPAVKYRAMSRLQALKDEQST